MNPRLQRIQYVMSMPHDLDLVEKLRYWVKIWRSQKENGEFQHKHPDFAVPLTHWAFDAHGMYSSPTLPRWIFWKRTRYLGRAS
jgi:hypothetical protein